MALSDEEKDALRRGASTLDPELVGQTDPALGGAVAALQDGLRSAAETGDGGTLDAIEEKARKVLADLEDANSRYPATQEFLRARGLTHVNQLDKDGVRDLRAHLEKTLAALMAGNA